MKDVIHYFQKHLIDLGNHLSNVLRKENMNRLNTITTLSIIIGLLIVVIILLCINIVRSRSDVSESKFKIFYLKIMLGRSPDISKDFSYLNQQIDFFIDNFLLIELNTLNRSLNDRQLFMDKNIKEFAPKLVYDIVESLSDDYKLFLGYYINDLDTYITHRVVGELTKIGLRHNAKQLNLMKQQERLKNTNKSNRDDT